MNATKTQTVEYNLVGEERFSKIAVGFSSIFVDRGSERRTMYMNRVLLKHLNSGSAYGKFFQ